MANTKKLGFRPVKTLGGGTITQERGRILSNGGAIYHGDAIVADTNGDILVATVTNTAVKSVSQGVSYVDSSLGRIERHHIPASITYSGSTVDPVNASYCYFVADPINVVFESSIDEAVAQADIGLNYVMILTTGNTTTGYSKHELDYTSKNTTATLPWRLRDVIRGRGDNDVDAADAAALCMINAGFSEPALTTTGT